MSDLLIRNIPEETRAALRARAAKNGRSQQAEVLAILETSLENPTRSWIARLREAAVSVGGIDIDEPVRHAPRDLNAPLWE